MDVRSLPTPDAGRPLGQSRAHVLHLLRAAGSPVSVRDIADQAGLHPNTVRFHLDALVDAGLAARTPTERTTPGRPSMAYRPVSGGGPVSGWRYRLLAEMLASLIAGMLPRPGETAAEVGREWGRSLTESPPPYRRLDAGEAVERLTAIMAEIGFAPEAVTDGTQYQLRLRHSTCTTPTSTPAGPECPSQPPRLVHRLNRAPQARPPRSAAVSRH